MAEGDSDKHKPEPIKIYGNDKLSDRVSAFKQQAEKHDKKKNPYAIISPYPFSSSSDAAGENASGSGSGSGATTSTGFSKDDPRYGRPPEGSKTEFRGMKAHSHIGKEVVELCSMIREYGEERADGSTIITFGELFQIYTVISNKVVGILLRARKHGLLHFDGEMLYQRRDDHRIITLFPTDE